MENARVRSNNDRLLAALAMAAAVACALGYSPRYNISAGLANAAEWYQANLG